MEMCRDLQDKLADQIIKIVQSKRQMANSAAQQKVPQPLTLSI
eukprot:CAMPEP_0185585796 /NCGR_PEP_ID=MMETSP0434-20130131/40923_1 /TAXON_ID=626734 ORGANISM="Favella taraikaensis, Strain Fe Narragansett Bay" /NCGR_SAMPLE_ID=MMETSP0434 /ASSEMBLY_ACC=CAM_ASM_000379 /LENGTH=42 /DNA_ID= /DNA_START= /DNA_END= /DNA_ORIENTATION=